MPLRVTAFAMAMVLGLTSAAGAAGSDSSEPPTPTPTATTCADGEIWDEATQACTAADSSSLNDDQRYRGLRELAYAGRYRSALIVADAMRGTPDKVLTYRGFIARKTGDWDHALSFYQAALAINPGNILTRSYLGQGYALRGQYDEARLQLAEIRARDGGGTWAETALLRALSGDETADY